jgi:hypothetical protein
MSHAITDDDTGVITGIADSEFNGDIIDSDISVTDDEFYSGEFYDAEFYETRIKRANIINAFISAVKKNDHGEIECLHLEHPWVKIDSTYNPNPKPSFTYPESIQKVLIYNHLCDDYDRVVNITETTYELLFRIGIIEPTNVKFLKKFITMCVCHEMCDIFFHIINFFDYDTMAKFVWTNLDDGINEDIYSITLIRFSLQSGSLLGVCPEHRAEYITWVNKLLSLGCKLDYSDDKYTDLALLISHGYSYDPETNVIC